MPPLTLFVPAFRSFVAKSSPSISLGYFELLLATAIYRHDPGPGGEQDSVRIFSERFELADPAVIVLGRPILTNSTTPVDRCGEPSDTASLFSAHPDTVSIDLPAHPLDPLEATRLFFTDDNYPCAF